jgi:hypothetical protein
MAKRNYSIIAFCVKINSEKSRTLREQSLSAILALSFLLPLGFLLQFAIAFGFFPCLMIALLDVISFSQF